MNEHVLMQNVVVTHQESDWVANVDLEWVYLQAAGSITPGTIVAISCHLVEEGARRYEPCRARSRKTGTSGTHRGMEGVRLVNPEHVVWDRITNPVDKARIADEINRRRDA